MRLESFRRTCVALVTLSLVSLGMQAPAVAGVVSTADRRSPPGARARAPSWTP